MMKKCLSVLTSAVVTLLCPLFKICLVIRGEDRTGKKHKQKIEIKITVALGMHSRIFMGHVLYLLGSCCAC